MVTALRCQTDAKFVEKASSRHAQDAQALMDALTVPQGITGVPMILPPQSARNARRENLKTRRGKRQIVNLVQTDSMQTIPR